MFLILLDSRIKSACLHTSYLKEGKVFGRCEFHKAGCKGRATSVGEAVDVTYTELQNTIIH